MPRMTNKGYDEEMDKYEPTEGEFIYRENIWHFYYFVAATIVPLLEDFADCAEFNPKYPWNMYYFNNPPSDCMEKKRFEKMITHINLLVKYFNEGGLKYRGRKINFENGDVVKELLDALHLFVNILPYLNERHYSIPKEKYDNAPYGVHACEYEELLNLDKTIARQIFNTLEAFSVMSIFWPKSLLRRYNFALPFGSTKKYDTSKEWYKALNAMVKSWKWILERTPEVDANGWEIVPEEIFYGLHQFAEYLPEMQND